MTLIMYFYNVALLWKTVVSHFFFLEFNGKDSVKIIDTIYIYCHPATVTAYDYHQLQLLPPKLLPSDYYRLGGFAFWLNFNKLIMLTYFRLVLEE